MVETTINNTLGMTSHSLNRSLDIEKVQNESPLKAFFNFEDNIADYFQMLHTSANNYLIEKTLELDEALPPNELQLLLDSFYETHLVPVLNHENLQEFNKWMDSNGNGEWYEKLGIALAKMPLRTVRAVLAQVYLILKSLTYSLVHPLKAMHAAAGFIVDLIYALTKGETYSKMGAGMVGAALGQPLVLLQPPVVIGLAVGSVLVISVLVHDILKTLVNAEEGCGWEDVKAMLKDKHFRPISEAFAVGLLTGIAAGIISRIFAPIETLINYDNPNWPTDYLEAYLKQNNYGQHNWIYREYIQENNSIIFSWINKPSDLTLSTWTGMWGNKLYYYSRLPLPALQKVTERISEVAVQAVTQFLVLGIKDTIPAEEACLI